MPMKTIEGYSKEKYTNTSVLLAGGGAKALSDFIGSLSWDSTNKKIKYTPVGGSATDLVTLSWDNIANKPTSLPANGGDADTVDNYHASNLTKFYLSPISSNSPADSAKSWFENTMPSGAGAIVYNVPGSEKTIIVGKSTGPYGHMLQLNYDDNYLRILRYQNGSWKTIDWEKISAGYADSAGSVAWGNITEKPFNWSGQSGQPTWLWGSNDGTNYYVWNPSNFNVNYAKSATSLESGSLKYMCSLYATNTYNAYKITTNWHKSNNAMPTINIRGYAYGSAKTIDCDIVMYHYNNDACSYSLTNKGSYSIRVWQVIENDVQVFYINPGEYFGMFNVFVYGGMSTDTFSNWSMTTVDAVSGTEIESKPIATSITGNAGSSNIASTVTVNSSDSNSTYRMVWHSDNTLYGTAGIYCNPATDYLYATSMQTSDWFRSTGNTGWYNSSYDGGWYMEDSTYIRTYNSKCVYNSNTSQYAFYTPGGITVGSHLWGTSTASSWLAGQKEDRAVINVTNSTDANSFWPLIKWTSSSQGRWDTIGVLGNNLYFMSSLTSRTENSYDTAAYFDMTTSRLYSNGVYHTSYGSSAYALTSDGGVASIANMRVNYANSAGSVAWDNVTGKPSSYTPTSHTHPYLPLSGGTLTGTLGKSNNYIFKPNGGDFRTTTNSYTGAICISLPANIGNTMLSMWIDVYNYTTNTSFSVHVGGYTYNSTFSNSPFAMVYGALHKVRLTYDNGFKIYIGEIDSTWNYPQISIRDVVLGFNQNYSNWSTDWSVSFITSFPTINREITRYAITTDNIGDQSVNHATSATNAENIWLKDSSTNSDCRLAFGTYNSSYVSLYSSQYLTYNPYSGRLKLKGSKEYNSVVKGGSISFGDGDFLYMKEAKDDVLLQHYKGLVSDTQPIAIGFVGSCPSNSSASLVYKKSQPSAITVNCTRVSSGRFKVEVHNTSGKPIIAHLQVTPVRNYAQYEFAFAYIEDFTMDTADGGMEISSGGAGYFYVRTGRIHCQGTWAAGDYVATGDTGGFTGVVYAMINESLATMPSTSW